MYMYVLPLKPNLFQVCDSILNIGPIADATIGTPDFISVSYIVHV